MRRDDTAGRTPPPHDNDGHAAILVVEDEPLVRLDIALALSDAGFAVIETGSAEEALELLRLRDSIGVVFTDVNLPGMDGLELRREISERWPHVAVLVTSGTEGEAVEALRGDDTFIPKPYDSGAVVSSVRAVAA